MKKHKEAIEMYEKGKEINKCNFENTINENGLVSHIKEVLKGDSINKLVKKLDFSKAVTMKHKLDKFNKK